MRWSQQNSGDSGMRAMKIVLAGNSGVGKSSLMAQFCWDTAGQDRFRSIVTTYYRNANGAVLVFDVTDLDSFDSISSWVEEVQKDACNLPICLLVGNKTDLASQRVISEKDGAAKAAELGMHYIEASAKEAINVEEAFLYLAKAWLKQEADTADSTNAPWNLNTLRLTAENHGRAASNKVRENCCKQ